MNTLQTWSALVALALATTLAQSQETSPPPMPSTSETEGTAADRTPPGETPTRDQRPATETNTPSDSMGPQPSTSETEGTAADRTPPGKTPTGTTATAREMVGATVVGADKATLGKVVDVVFDAKGQPEFVVISTEQGKSAAVPYRTASAMKSGKQVVIDKSKLQRAPTVKQGEWRSQSETWKEDSSRYWDQG